MAEPALVIPDPEILPEVQQLLAAHIETYDQLEVLLLLHTSRDRFWTPDEVAASLKLPPTAALAALEHLLKEKLALAGAPIIRQFKYGPVDATTDEIVAKLAVAYTNNRVQVIRLLSSNAIERVRSDAIKLFADSFLLGRSKKDG